MANQERPGTGRPEIDTPATPHPSREDREIQNPPPRTNPTENPKVRANQKSGQGKSSNPPTTPVTGGDEDDETIEQRPGRDRLTQDQPRRADQDPQQDRGRQSNPAGDPERRTETERKGNR